MKLWLITQNVNNGYDTYDSAVVKAETADEARVTHPDGYHYWKNNRWMAAKADGSEYEEGRYGTWANPDLLTVVLLGESVDGTPGVVCSSFNAG